MPEVWCLGELADARSVDPYEGLQDGQKCWLEARIVRFVSFERRGRRLGIRPCHQPCTLEVLGLHPPRAASLDV